MRELGVTGVKILAGLIYEEVNPQLQGLNGYKIYQQMRFDPTCAAGLKTYEFPVRSARWFVQPASDDPADVEKADFIHDQLFYFGSQSMDDVIRLAFTHLPFGFSWLENCYEFIPNGRWQGKIGWTKLAWRSPSTKWRWNMGEVDGAQELISVTQLAPPYYEQIDIPRNKLMIFVHQQEGDNYDGWSLLRPAYKPYFFRDKLYIIQAIGLERAFAGIPKISLPIGYSPEMASLAKQIVTNLRTDEQAGVVLTEDMVMEMLFNKLEGAAMQLAIEHHDTQIVGSMLSDFVKLGHKAVGTQALSADKTDLFLYALNAEANAFAQVVNLAPGIPQLVRYNFVDADDLAMPRLTHGDIGERALDRLGRTLMALGQWGFLTPDDATEDKLREMLDLPEREYDFEDRDLLDLITQAQPMEPTYRVTDRNLSPRLRPNTLVPDPTDPRSQGMLPQPQQPAGNRQPGQAPVGGGRPTETATSMSEYRRMQAEAYERFMAGEVDPKSRMLDMRLKNRWARPKGRPDAATRIRIKLAERLAEDLNDLQSHFDGVPERPSERVARLRLPYVVRAGEIADKAKRLAGRPGPRALRSGAIGTTLQHGLAKSYETGLFHVLRPRPKGDPPPPHVEPARLGPAPSLEQVEPQPKV
jgi:hypothetical protein